MKQVRFSNWFEEDRRLPIVTLENVKRRRIYLNARLNFEFAIHPRPGETKFSRSFRERIRTPHLGERFSSCKQNYQLPREGVGDRVDARVEFSVDFSSNFLRRLTTTPHPPARDLRFNPLPRNLSIKSRVFRASVCVCVCELGPIQHMFRYNVRQFYPQRGNIGSWHTNFSISAALRISDEFWKLDDVLM